MDVCLDVYIISKSVWILKTYAPYEHFGYWTLIGDPSPNSILQFDANIDKNDIKHDIHPKWQVHRDLYNIKNMAAV